MEAVGGWVIFSSLALANLMQHVATAASAFSVDAGMSSLAEQLGDAVPRLLSNIERLGRKQQQIHWWEVEMPVFTPAALVRDVPVTKSFR